ncbi:MAG: 3-ketoacyl-ACP reductase [Paenibacillus sp.]|nr:3-ketoacyl-ACP reductase [Paenibacillus sp.]
MFNQRKKAVVTGGSRGIGRGIVLALAAQEYDVAICHLNDIDHASETVRMVKERYGRDCFVMEGDLATEDFPSRFAEFAIRSLGRVDVLVNNAGMNIPNDLTAANSESIDRQLHLNFRAPLLLMRDVGLHMMEMSTKGVIINITSSRGERAYPGDGVYGGAKAALARASQSAALELAAYGIRVNCIAPGITRISEAIRSFYDGVEKKVPLGRVGTPEDIGDAVAWLVSGRSSYVTGITLRVDGGLILPGMPEDGSEMTAGGWGGTRRSSLQIYIGSYAGESEQSISLFRLSDENGAISIQERFDGVANPSFMAIDRTRRMLYAVSEMTQNPPGTEEGVVHALSIAPDGRLLPHSRGVIGRGAACHVAMSPDAGALYTASFFGGTVARIGLEPDGGIGKATALFDHRQLPAAEEVLGGEEGGISHPHSVAIDRSSRFALVPDLGRDEIVVYRIKPGTDMTLSRRIRVDAGSGPRHFVFHPKLSLGYLFNQLSSTVKVFRYDESEGDLEQLQTVSTLPEGYKGENHGSEIRIHPSGQWLYAANRGHDSIAVFRIHSDTGFLTRETIVSSHGRCPRHFDLSPDGRWLVAANQESDAIVVFRIDSLTGKPEVVHIAEAVRPAFVLICPSRPDWL